MNDTIRLILSLSVSGSILALLWLLIKPLVRNKLSKRVQYIIWIIILLRFLLPVSFENSFMNRFFYQYGTENLSEKVTVIQNETETVNHSEFIDDGAKISSADYKDTKDNAAVLSADKKPLTFGQALTKYSFPVWLAGALTLFLYHIISYLIFVWRIRLSSVPAAGKQMEILQEITKGDTRIILERNQFITTPMLIGIRRPCIIIPDYDMTENGEMAETVLRNILRHEVTHRKHCDILWKWLLLLAAAIHWFHPLIYLIRKEINRACELACDEAVIKNLNQTEKQSYGDTLIAVAAKQSVPRAVLQATMCEEKRSLKERLLAIMQYNKKSEMILAFSSILALVFVITGVVLGAGIGYAKTSPPKMIINTDHGQIKEAVVECYEWKFNKNTEKESFQAKPEEINYAFQHIISISGGEELILSVQNQESDLEYDFTTGNISVSTEGPSGQKWTPQTYMQNHRLYLTVPEEAGAYTVSIQILIPERGTVTFGFQIMVDRMVYNLEEIAKYKNPYVGNHSKDIAIAGNLPVPDSFFLQQYISLQTKEAPYGMTIYYESAKEQSSYGKTWPVTEEDSRLWKNSEVNALVVFCMIDNVENLTFAFRDTKSEAGLEESAYETSFTFWRSDFEERFGDLTALGNDLNALQKLLEKQ